MKTYVIKVYQNLETAISIKKKSQILRLKGPFCLLYMENHFFTSSPNKSLVMSKPVFLFLTSYQIKVSQITYPRNCMAALISQIKTFWNKNVLWKMKTNFWLLSYSYMIRSFSPSQRCTKKNYYFWKPA